MDGTGYGPGGSSLLRGLRGLRRTFTGRASKCLSGRQLLTAIPITNAGFESPGLGDGGSAFPVPGWTLGLSHPEYGEWPQAAAVANPSDDPAPTEGDNYVSLRIHDDTASWAQHAAFEQTLSSVVQPNKVYTLDAEDAVDAAEVMPAARPSATYKPMGAMPLLLFAAAVFSCAVATAAPATAPAMFPDPDLQTQLQRVAEIPEREEPVARYAEAIKLREMVGNRAQDYEKLILNIAYFAKGGPSNVHSSGKTYVYHYLCRVLDLNRPAVLAALLPHLASDDVSLRQFLHSDVIWGAESLPGAEGAAEYVSFVRMRPNQVCGALLHELYQKDLEAALLGLGSVYVRDPPSARALIWSAHLITEAHWRWEHHFANSADLEPALVELRRIATSPEAWQRLYVAEVLTQWREFVDADLLAKLREDADPTVRDVAGRSKPPKPPPWPGHVPESR